MSPQTGRALLHSTRAPSAYGYQCVRHWWRRSCGWAEEACGACACEATAQRRAGLVVPQSSRLPRRSGSRRRRGSRPRPEGRGPRRPPPVIPPPARLPSTGDPAQRDQCDGGSRCTPHDTGSRLSSPALGSYAVSHVGRAALQERDVKIAAGHAVYGTGPQAHPASKLGGGEQSDTGCARGGCQTHERTGGASAEADPFVTVGGARRDEGDGGAQGVIRPLRFPQAVGTRSRPGTCGSVAGAGRGRGRGREGTGQRNVTSRAPRMPTATGPTPTQRHCTHRGQLYSG